VREIELLLCVYRLDNWRILEVKAGALLLLLFMAVGEHEIRMASLFFFEKRSRTMASWQKRVSKRMPGRMHGEAQAGGA
jgi:hypothetical protein